MLFFWILLFLLIWHSALRLYRTKKNARALAKFGWIPLINTYEIAKQKIDLGGPKIKNAVLLLHGFSTSPNDFSLLIQRLQKENIPYYAPVLTGFGLSDFHLLEKIQPSDWIRDVFNAYDTLAAIAETIDVVGYSNGACLAALLDRHRTPRRLIFASPYFFYNKQVRFKYRILSTPIIKELLYFLLPLAAKLKFANRKFYQDILDSSQVPSFFASLYLTPQSVAAIWELRKMIDFSKPFSAETYALFGAQDQVIGYDKSKELFLLHNPSKNIFELPNSAHLIFQDFEHARAIDIVIKILKQ